MHTMNEMPEMRVAAAEIERLLRESMIEPRPWGAGGLGTERIQTRFFSSQGEGLRLSHGSICDRRLWYARHEPVAAVTADGATKMKFAFGDTFESLMLSALGGHLEHSKGPWRLDPVWAQKELAVVVEGEEILGHPDGMLTFNGAPYAIVDAKSTTIWSWKKWEELRKPDPVWGYRRQAGDYVYASGVPNLAGFMWLVGIMDNNNINDYRVGWMTKGELLADATAARDSFTTAIVNLTPPRPVCLGRDGVPCRGKTTVYCRFYDHCIKDRR